MIDFDKGHWLKVIARPDWYLELIPWFKQVQDSLGEASEEANQFRKTIRHFFEEQLEAGKVALAAEGPDFDAEREPIDTIVIHHTSALPGYRLSYMNAVQLQNVYAPHFANSKDGQNKYFKGQPTWEGNPIWSGHFRNGRPSFLVYHWLMRMDGKFERLLEDSQIGWHAGNWEINRRSIAICLDNDYEEQDPTDEILQKLADFIKNTYPLVKPDKIIGHCEARDGTICPGTNFKTVWKTKLLSYI